MTKPAEFEFAFFDRFREGGEAPGTLVVEAWAGTVSFTYTIVKCIPYSDDFDAVAAALRQFLDLDRMRFSRYNGELPSGWADLDSLGVWSLEGGFHATP